MARPGLEPGTPRFSWTRAKAHRSMKDLQTKRFRPPHAQRDAVGFAWFGAGLGLRDSLRVPSISIDRRPSTRERGGPCSLSTGAESKVATGRGEDDAAPIPDASRGQTVRVPQPQGRLDHRQRRDRSRRPRKGPWTCCRQPSSPSQELDMASSACWSSSCLCCSSSGWSDRRGATAPHRPTRSCSSPLTALSLLP